MERVRKFSPLEREVIHVRVVRETILPVWFKLFPVEILIVALHIVEIVESVGHLVVPSGVIAIVLYPRPARVSNNAEK